MSRLSRYGRPYKLPLSEADIRRALRLGTGRVYLHQQSYGLTDHTEALFRACCKNMVYDVQCEPARAPWLIDLVEPDKVEELIRRLVSVIPSTKKAKDLYQICELCLLLAKKGHSLARSALYSAFQPGPYGGMIAYGEIIDLDGAEGLTWLCHKTIEMGLEDIENVVWQYASHYDFAFGEGEAEIVLSQVTSLNALWSLFEAEPELSEEARGQPQHSKESVKKLSVPDLVELIDSTDAPYYIRALSLWSQSASEEQLDELADKLAKEKSAHRLRHFLSVFRRRILPGFEVHSDSILKLTSHDDWYVRTRTNTALSAICHPKIRAQTLACLRSRQWLEGQLLPLKSNLHPGDSALLTEHLKVDRSAYKHHRLIFDLVEICQQNPWPEMVELMMFIYQTSPCTNCREAIYQAMLKESLVPAWMAAVWPFDVNSIDRLQD